MSYPNGDVVVETGWLESNRPLSTEKETRAGGSFVARPGREDVSIYDASLREWAADPSLPMQVLAAD